MVTELKERYKNCITSKNDTDINILIRDIVVYIVNNGWEFILDLQYPPFITANKKDAILVFSRKEKATGFYELATFAITDIQNNKSDFSGIPLKERFKFIKQAIIKIPVC